MARKEMRRHARRAKSIRFRFDAEGDEHRAVTTLVSLSGAFFKSSYVPAAGETMTLREVYTQGDADLYLRGEVVWNLAAPTLEQPDTGFGMDFDEVFTRGDPRLLEEFLSYLDPTVDARFPLDVRFEERSDGVCAVYRFDAAEVPAETPPPSIRNDAPPSVDLAHELDRLGRRERTTKVASGPATAEADDDAPKRRPRSGRRSVTGLFTALFAKKRGAAGKPGAGAGAADGAPVRDVRLPRLIARWAAAEAPCRILGLSSTLATVVTNATAPEKGEVVVLRPADAEGGIAALRVHGMVTAKEPADSQGATRFRVSFGRIEEPGGRGDFEAWLRLVNGPGANPADDVEP